MDNPVPKNNTNEIKLGKESLGMAVAEAAFENSRFHVGVYNTQCKEMVNMSGCQDFAEGEWRKACPSISGCHNKPLDSLIRPQRDSTKH